MEAMTRGSRIAVERAMTIQEVILKAMAKRLSWIEASEILGYSERHMRRVKARYEREGFHGLYDGRCGKLNIVGSGGRDIAVVQHRVFRFQCSAFSREVIGKAWIYNELHVDKEPAAEIGIGGPGGKANGSPQEAREASDERDVAAYRRIGASMVSGWALVRPDRDHG